MDTDERASGKDRPTTSPPARKQSQGGITRAARRTVAVAQWLLVILGGLSLFLGYTQLKGQLEASSADLAQWREGQQQQWRRTYLSLLQGEVASKRELAEALGDGGVVGFGDRLTRTVQIDAISLNGPRGGYRPVRDGALYDRWAAWEPGVTH